jgi:hypothetical protein
MQQSHQLKTSSLMAEFGQLKKVWTSAPSAEVARAREEVAALAERAGELTRRLDAAQRAFIATVEGRKTAVTDELQGLRRGRGMMRKFMPQSLTEPGFIDKKM